MINASSNPYDELIGIYGDTETSPVEDEIIEFSMNEAHAETGAEKTTPELNEREHGSFLQENYSKIWIDNQNNKKITNLISFGIIAGVGVLILKRYFK